MSNFMKILPVGAELSRADWQTDMMKLIVAFINFAKAPKNGSNRNTADDRRHYALKWHSTIRLLYTCSSC